MTVVSAERAKDGYLLGKDEGEAYWLLGMLQTIKIGRDDTAGQYGLLEIVVPAGVGSPWQAEQGHWSASRRCSSRDSREKSVSRQPSGCCRRRSRATRTWSGCSRAQSATGWSSSALPGHLPATEQSAIQRPLAYAERARTTR